MRSRTNALAAITALFAGLAFTAAANAATVTEDFTSTAQWDSASSTGVWNSIGHEARAAVFSDGDPARPITFGDGSDGEVNTASGFNFDTDAHQVYQFRSLTISGGSISITGKNPLIIQSLGAVNISPSISAKGGDGQNGSTVTLTTAPAGGTPIAGGGSGGAGGNIVTGVAQVGSDGLKPDGSPDTSAAGGAVQTSGTASSDELLTPDFDLLNPLIAGGGGGGGARTVVTSATGGGGGAGGGVVRISALGPITFNSINASGGAAGLNAGANPNCSGYGSPGNGGAVWLQSISAISGIEPVVAAGTTTSTGCGVPATTLDGTSRADTIGAVAPSGWSTSYVTDSSLAVPSQTYTIQSKGYDLHTLNAVFTAQADVLQSANSGTIAVNYSGSADGTTYSADTTDLTTLSNQGYRYVRFKIAITTAGSAGLSPIVTRVSIPYTEKGVADLDLSLGFGCGSLALVGAGSHDDRNGGSSSAAHAAEFVLLLIAFAGTLRFYRRVADEKRFDRNAFPA